MVTLFGNSLESVIELRCVLTGLECALIQGLVFLLRKRNCGHRYTEEEDTGRPQQRLEGEVYQPRATSAHWKLAEGRKDPPGASEGPGL